MLKVTISGTNIYDHQGRKIKAWQQLTNADGTADLAPDTRTLLSKLDYNEIGQLRADNQHSTDSIAYLQTLNNTYNERGWLSKITTNTNKLMVDLRYNDADAGIAPQFNGNIAQQLYSGQYSGSKSFTYSYDKLNRLTNAALGTGTTLNEAITYDGRGNILTLNRGGQSYTTPLAYTYGSSGVSNQLATVAATGFTTRNYSYDGNGNATTDGGSLAITYNLLNLPQTVKLTGTTKATYIYDARGQKLHATQTGSDRDYIDGIIYNNNTIEYIATEEGRATPNGATAYNYSYDLKDHLGNVRVTVDKDPTAGTARVVQEDEYYAFGLRVNKYDPSNHNVNLYNGKELQTDLQNQYDYGARLYDPVIGRFTIVDPLATKYPWYTPYQFAGNEVPNAIDRDGLEPAYPRADGTYTIARDGQLQRPLSDAAAKDFREYYKSKVPGGEKEIDPATQLFAAVITPILGAINTLVTGENMDGSKANTLDYAMAPLLFLSALPMKGGEVGGVGVKEFNGQNETLSSSSREAFRNAKDQNGIPRSQQPNKVIKPNTPEGQAIGLDGRNVKQYEFTNSNGQNVSIRQDKPATYGDGGKGDQGPHYNAGQNAQNPKHLPQHHNY